MFDPVLLAALSGTTFSPRTLFASGEQGAWYDPSDFSTMFQDDLGTTPVTATGQAVGLIRDKSGRGNHASQATGTSRPVLQQEATGQYYLAFDGTDDSLATASINFSATDKMSVFAGVRKLSDASAFGVPLELGNRSGALAGSFTLHAPGSAGSTYWWASEGTVIANLNIASGYAAPITNVLTGVGDISGDIARLRINGSVAGTTTTDQGTGNYGNYPLYIGRRNNTTLPFNGRLYSLIVRGAQSTPEQIEATERWVNGKTGAY